MAQPLARRAISLVAAMSQCSLEEAARLPIGERDSRLLSLREQTFGPELSSAAECPRCGAELDLTLRVADLRVAVHEAQACNEIEAGEYRISFRNPNTIDLLAAERFDDVEQSWRCLLERCVLSAAKAGIAIEPGELPQDVIDAIERGMERSDPLADIQLAIACYGCHHSWRQPFDIVSFLWAELEIWARRTLRDVHVLARHYGWREQDILALSPWRRQFYIAMVPA